MGCAEAACHWSHHTLRAAQSWEWSVWVHVRTWPCHSGYLAEAGIRALWGQEHLGKAAWNVDEEAGIGLRLRLFHSSAVEIPKAEQLAGRPSPRQGDAWQSQPSLSFPGRREG